MHSTFIRCIDSFILFAGIVRVYVCAGLTYRICLGLSFFFWTQRGVAVA